MKKHLIYLVLSLSCVLQACDNNSQEVQIKLEVPQFARAINASNLLAVVDFDDGDPETILFDDASEKTFRLTGVGLIPDEVFPITVDWYEEIDGVNLPLSRQSGNYSVNAENTNININATHVTSFDNDRDGFYNITERKNNTCPWVVCNQDGHLIRPASVTMVEIRDFANLILEGSDQWVSGDSRLRTLETTRTKILLKSTVECTVCEPFRGHLLDLNFSNGRISFSANETDEDEFIFRSLIDGAE